MEIHIKEKKDNELLDRTEIVGTIKYDGSVPYRKDIRKKIAEMFNVDELLVIIKQIKPKFGLQEADLFINLYKDISLLKKVENLKKKHVQKQLEQKKESKKVEEEKKSTEKQEESKKEKPQKKIENKDEKNS